MMLALLWACSGAPTTPAPVVTPEPTHQADHEGFYAFMTDPAGKWVPAAPSELPQDRWPDHEDAEGLQIRALPDGGAEVRAVSLSQGDFDDSRAHTFDAAGTLLRVERQTFVVAGCEESRSYTVDYTGSAPVVSAARIGVRDAEVDALDPSQLPADVTEACGGPFAWLGEPADTTPTWDRLDAVPAAARARIAQ